ncbi:MAG: diphthine--ammonia ligase [Dehalococcoidales bacterium]|nr:diphthine--ammonia ligase [Dehalococcoidales bacterium]
MEKVIVCWSGGKDSALAFHELSKSHRYEVVSLLTTVTADYDRISMHGVRCSLLRQQARNMGMPLCEISISRICSNEEYEAKMAAALTGFKKDGVSSVVFGDIFLEDLRCYREENLARLGMKAIFPIWRRDTTELARSLVPSGFQAITACVDTRKLDKSFAGRLIDEQFLNDLPEGVDPCGENGEYHSFVFDGPIFKSKILFSTGEKVLRDSFFCFCDLVPVGGGVVTNYLLIQS